MQLVHSVVNNYKCIYFSFCTGREIDVIARHQLWDVGLEYKHGTGHGIGAYLSVHEGKCSDWTLLT